MRASIVIAACNEGEAVARTVETCVDTTYQLDCELILADDASTDGSVQRVLQRFPMIQSLRHERRRGSSPTKASGAQRARGQVLVFLDGHTKPEHGAILRLVQAVERLEGRAIVTPAIAALDVASWRNDLDQVGHGYGFDLLEFDSQWLNLEELRRDEESLYESPALIGCAFAISRELYQHVCGFDAHMRSWGVEDLDLGLKAWLLGARILHDPDAVVGHHFRTSFDNYAVPVEHVVANQLRMARKHFTHSVWEAWLTAKRQSTQGQTDSHPEGVWARAWHHFQADRATAEQERSYLQGHRVHDEFWYAQRFGLAWPHLHAGLAAGDTGPGPAASRRLAAVPGEAAGPSSPLGVAPSPSPPPPRCRVTGVVPSPTTVVAGVTKQFTAQGTALTGVQWSAPGGVPSTGHGPTFTVKWNTPGARSVTASCGGSSQTAKVTVTSPPCRFGITGPTSVPGLSQYQYSIVLPAGKTASSIQWHVDKHSAVFQGATNQPTVTVAFAKGTADWISLTATFILDGSPQCAATHIALVKVGLGARAFTNPGRPSSAPVTVAFLVNPPAPPAIPTWVTTHVPGSDAAAFTYNGSNQAPEPGNEVLSAPLGAGLPQAFRAQTTVTLTAPSQQPTAVQRIEVGYIQAGADSGSASYASSPPRIRHRQITIPTTTTVDWLSATPSPTDVWPWYDKTSMARGSGSGTWSTPLPLTDSPALFLPAQFNPNNPADPDATKGIIDGTDAFAFQIHIAARTIDSGLKADTFYFDQAHSTWSVNFAWPVVPGVSIVTFAAAGWDVPGTASAIDVNVVPTVKNHNIPFLRWIPAKYVDHTPDLTSEEFWDSHEVAIVRVVRLDSDPVAGSLIRTQVISRLNSTATDPEPVFAMRDMWFSPDPEDRMRVQAGDALALFIEPGGPPIVAQRLISTTEESALLQSLQRIASLRLGEGGIDALRDGALDPDPLVAQYSLKRLIKDAHVALPDSHLAQLRRTRDDETAGPDTRLLAAELAFQREGKQLESDDPYAWLQTSIARSTQTDWTRIAPFARRLAAIPARQGETTTFLVGLATDEQASEAVRIAAYSSFEDLIATASAAEAEQIIQACLQMLRSSSPVIRQAGATLLYNFSIRGGPGPLEGLAERAASAIRSAQEQEDDDQARLRLERLTELLSRRAAAED
jgi:GT2 family glycosyltransferase